MTEHAKTPMLHHNLPGQAVVAKLIEEQQNVRPRGTLAQLFGVSPLHPDNRPWYWGALGEHAVGGVLAGLPAPWRALHAVPVGTKDSDIDHVVVGPAGVFTVNTKNHSHQSVWVAGRTFMVAGQRQPWIRNSEHEARRAAKLLAEGVGFPVPVRPLIVVHDPVQLVIKERPAEVTVVTTRSLHRWLRKQPARLSPEQVAQVFDVASRSTTWRKTPAPTVNSTENASAFARLNDEVKTAMRVRMLWRLGGVLSVMAVSLRVLGSLG